jgi:hypothetical protein
LKDNIILFDFIQKKVLQLVFAIRVRLPVRTTATIRDHKWGPFGALVLKDTNWKVTEEIVWISTNATKRHIIAISGLKSVLIVSEVFNALKGGNDTKKEMLTITVHPVISGTQGKGDAPVCQ